MKVSQSKAMAQIINNKPISKVVGNELISIPLKELILKLGRKGINRKGVIVLIKILKYFGIVDDYSKHYVYIRIDKFEKLQKIINNSVEKIEDIQNFEENG